MFASLIDKTLDASVVLGFTNVGYALRRNRFETIGESLEGRTVILTGGTSGLGRSAAETIAGLGAHLIVVGRDAAKTARSVDEIKRITGNQEVTGEIADLSLMSDTRALADRILAQHDRIHVLINNAGALFNRRSETEEGIELTLATNLLSHFLLTNLLIPRMVESAPSRIINVSSGGMYAQRIRVRDLQWTRPDWNGSAAYARTKRGQVILTEMWAERLEGTGVTVHSMHPGWADTPGVAASLPTFQRLLEPLLRSPEQGADTMVWLAAADEPGETTGLFWHDRRPRPTHRIAATREKPEDREELWHRLTQLSGWAGD